MKRNYTRAIAFRRGLIRARGLLRTRRDLIQEAGELLRRNFSNAGNEIVFLKRTAEETLQCIQRIDHELERLPKIRGRKWGR
jgi:hypothetical protein